MTGPEMEGFLAFSRYIVAEHAKEKEHIRKVKAKVQAAYRK